MTPKLTDEQRQALTTHNGAPVYVLLSVAEYQRLQDAEKRSPVEEPDEDDTEVPPGIQRSMAAFLRDLPELMQKKKYLGKWVAYHGEERLGFATTRFKLDQLCLGRGLKLEEYYVGWIGDQMEDTIDVEELLDV